MVVAGEVAAELHVAGEVLDELIDLHHAAFQDEAGAITIVAGAPAQVFYLAWVPATGHQVITTAHGIVITAEAMAYGTSVAHTPGTHDLTVAGSTGILLQHTIIAPYLL